MRGRANFSGQHQQRSLYDRQQYRNFLHGSTHTIPYAAPYGNPHAATDARADDIPDFNPYGNADAATDGGPYAAPNCTPNVVAFVTSNGFAYARADCAAYFATYGEPNDISSTNASPDACPDAQSEHYASANCSTVPLTLPYADGVAVVSSHDQPGADANAITRVRNAWPVLRRLLEFLQRLFGWALC